MRDYFNYYFTEINTKKTKQKDCMINAHLVFLFFIFHFIFVALVF